MKMYKNIYFVLAISVVFLGSFCIVGCDSDSGGNKNFTVDTGLDGGDSGGSAGTLDTTFGAEGFVMFDSAPNALNVQQQDVRVLDANKKEKRRMSVVNRMAKRRYNPQRHKRVAKRWKVQNRQQTGEDYCYGVAVSKDNQSIVTVGSVEVASGIYEILVVKLDVNGKMDTKFGNNGSISFALHEDGYDHAFGVKIKDSGKIVIVGTSYNFWEDFNAFIVQLNADGTFDKEFGKDGKVFFDGINGPVGTFEVSSSVVIDKKGRIVVAGCTDNKEWGMDVFVARLDEKGKLDKEFGKGGIANFGGDTRYFEGSAVTLDDKGRVIVAGELWGDATNKGLLVRFLADGKIDESFGTKGFSSFAVDPSLSDFFNAVAYDSARSRIVAAGGTETANNSSLVACFHNNGTLDTSFNDTGFLAIETVEESLYEEFNAVLIDDSGNTFLVGDALGSMILDTKSTIVKLNKDGTKDDDYGIWGNGMVLGDDLEIMAFIVDETPYAAAIQIHDGKAKIIMTAEVGNNTNDVGVVRIK